MDNSFRRLKGNGIFSNFDKWLKIAFRLPKYGLVGDSIDKGRDVEVKCKAVIGGFHNGYPLCIFWEYYTIGVGEMSKMTGQRRGEWWYNGRK